MKLSALASAIALSLIPTLAGAGGSDWQRYTIAQSGAAVEIPVGIFGDDVELPDGGLGRRFYTNDRRANMTVQSIPNPANDSPSEFLAKQRPPANIVYKRITPDFFVVSSFRNGKIFYDRCNRSRDYLNCVLINYPAAEKSQWDAIVTRISHTLTN